MLTAYDTNREQVDATDAIKGDPYRCICCNELMIVRQGNIMRWHFAHKAHTNCPYDADSMCEWHQNWQLLFGAGNYEVPFEMDVGDDGIYDTNTNLELDYGSYRKIADVQINDTVVEFQHSPIPSKEVLERCAFHLCSHRRIIWVVDYIDRRDNLVNENVMHESIKLDGYFKWKYALHWFDQINMYDGLIEVYLQTDQNELVRIIDHTHEGASGYQEFIGRVYTKSGFISRVLKLSTYDLDDNYKKLPKIPLEEAKHIDAYDMFETRASDWTESWMQVIGWPEFSKYREISNGQETHTADIVINGYVIKFLDDVIPEEEFRTVNEFYTNIYSAKSGRNLKVIWIIMAYAINTEISYKHSDKIRWSYYNYSIKNYVFDNPNVIIFIDRTELNGEYGGSNFLYEIQRYGNHCYFNDRVNSLVKLINGEHDKMRTYEIEPSKTFDVQFFDYAKFIQAITMQTL